MAANETASVKKKADQVPRRWFNYSRFKHCIPGTQILPMKTPLKRSYNSGFPNCSKNKAVPLSNEFTPGQLIRDLSSQGMKLRLVINVTGLDHFYDKEEFESRNIQYCKLYYWEGKVPPPYICSLFADAVLKQDKKGIIAVHCTNGVDTTGYLLCWFLMKYHGYSFDNAIKAFENARGHKIEKECYLNDLREKYQARDPLVKHHYDAKQRKKINKSKDGIFYPKRDPKQWPVLSVEHCPQPAAKKESTHCNHDAVQKKGKKEIEDGGLDPRQCPVPSQKHCRQQAKKKSAHYNRQNTVQKRERKEIIMHVRTKMFNYSIQCPLSSQHCRRLVKKQSAHYNHDAVQKRERQEQKSERKEVKKGGLDPRHSIQCPVPSQYCPQPAKKQSAAHYNHDAIQKKERKEQKSEKKKIKNGGVDPRQCPAPSKKQCQQAAKKQSAHCNHGAVQTKEKKEQKKKTKKIKNGGLNPTHSIQSPAPSQPAKKQSAHCNHNTVQKRAEKKEIKNGGLDLRHSIQCLAPIGEHCHHQQAMSKSHKHKKPEQHIQDYIVYFDPREPSMRMRGERRKGREKVKVWWEERNMKREKNRLMVRKRIWRTLRKR